MQKPKALIFTGEADEREAMRIITTGMRSSGMLRTEQYIKCHRLEDVQDQKHLSGFGMIIINNDLGHVNGLTADPSKIIEFATAVRQGRYEDKGLRVDTPIVCLARPGIFGQELQNMPVSFVPHKGAEPGEDFHCYSYAEGAMQPPMYIMDVRSLEQLPHQNDTARKNLIGRLLGAALKMAASPQTQMSVSGEQALGNTSPIAIV